MPSSAVIRARRKQQWETMTLPAMEFMRRFLQHVLPRGTHKVRYYGFWNPSQRSLLRRVQLVIGSAQISPATDDAETTQTDSTPEGAFEKPRKCPCCSEGILVLVQTIPRQTRGPP